MIVPVVPALAALLLVAAPASGQVLSRLDVRFDGQHLSGTDDRFDWVFNLGIDVDLLDWGFGRGIFRANYEVLTGVEFRRFDANQGNYLLEGEVTVRAAGAELGGVFHHMSRHLSDRAKRFPIDWNMVGARVRGDWARGRAAVVWQGDARATVLKSYVDYDWELLGESGARYRVGRRISLIGSGRVHVIGVDGSRGRGRQTGGRGEGGVRLDGGRAAVELFVAVERRIDPYPLEFGTVRWVTAGLRLLSR